jgi:hypothetical protein
LIDRINSREEFTMLSQARLDERFLDRGGCGDELYGDAHLKASTWLAGIAGEQSFSGDRFEAFDDANGDDDFATH